MELLKLPNELVLAIGDWADAPTVSALARTSRRLHDLLNPLLYRHNARDQQSDALVWAAENGRVGTAKLCLSYGADINTSSSIKEENEHRDYPTSGTPLHYAVRRGHDDLVEYLFANGADHQRWCTRLCKCFARPRAATNSNSQAAIFTSHWSPLHLALCNGHTSTAKILLDRGASCEMTHQLSMKRGPRANELRPSPVNVLHEVVIHKNLEVLDYMITSSYPLQAMVNLAAFHGSTPLHFVANMWSRGSAQILDRLLSLGPDLNVPNIDMRRPIECFVGAGAMVAAQRLFRLGARPFSVNRCILSASKQRLLDWGPSEPQDTWIEARNELVVSLIDHALDTGHLKLDVGQRHEVALQWCVTFQVVCTQLSILHELQRAGLKPESLGGGQLMLLTLLEKVTTKRGGDNVERSLWEAAGILTRAAGGWGMFGMQHKTPLEYLVKDTGCVAPETREALFSNLLRSRPPGETGSEQAHLNHLCQFALDNGDTQAYQILVRHGALECLVRGPIVEGSASDISRT